MLYLAQFETHQNYHFQNTRAASEPENGPQSHVLEESTQIWLFA